MAPSSSLVPIRGGHASLPSGALSMGVPSGLPPSQALLPNIGIPISPLFQASILPPTPNRICALKATMSGNAQSFALMICSNSLITL